MTPAERAELQSEMVRLAEGDRSALEPVFRRVRPLVRELAGKMLRSDADAEDVAQQVLLNVFQRAAEFDRSRDAVAWIVGITAWSCRTRRREVVRRREASSAVVPHVMEVAVAVGSDSVDPELALIERELEQSAQEVLLTLRPEDVETLRAAMRGERPEDGSVAPATFRKRLQRAMERWREAWKERHDSV